MFQYPFGVQELWGIAARGNYDLTQHAKASGKPQEIFDEASKKKFVPHVIEPAVGVDRIFLAVLCAGLRRGGRQGRERRVEKRTVLRSQPAHRPGQSRRAAAAQEQGGTHGRARELYKKAAAPVCVPSTTTVAPSAAATAARTRSARRGA
jgi:glycyl-tRNA synthetase